MKCRLEAIRPAPLAACLGAVFGLAAHATVSASTTHVITSCDDGATAATTPGTLRYEILHAMQTDAINVSNISVVCGTSYLTLYEGEIPITQSALAIYGSGSTNAIRTIHGRIFKHTGAGTLSISELTIESGYYSSAYSSNNADGGCIYSAGNVTLTNASVIDCEARLYKPSSGSPQVRGGAIFAKGKVTLTGSKVSGNLADTLYDSLNSPVIEAIGGGIYAGSVSADYSTIAGNTALADMGAMAGGVYTHGNLSATHSTIADNLSTASFHTSRAGGAFVVGDLTLDSTTVSNNRSNKAGGIFQGATGHLCTISNSTISGNTAYLNIGGMVLYSPATISNSTIVFNKSSLNAGGVGTGADVTLRSSIMADNQGGGGNPQDLAIGGTLSGEANLVMSTNASPPLGVITVTGEPHLTPLANHGGPTFTHAVLASSPAIAAGSNPANFPYDQRGPGFDRKLSIPPPAALTWTDIGAYQRQLVDYEIFYDGLGPLPGG